MRPLGVLQPGASRRGSLGASACVWAALALLSICTSGAQCQQQPAGGTRMSFEFANPALTPAAWHLDFDADGAGHYHSEPGPATPPNAQGGLPEPFDQQIRISAALRQELFAIARTHKLFATQCENTKQKVAFTGRKTVSYSGPEGQGSCTFNWTPDMRMMKLVNSFLGVSLTLEEGRKLRLEYLHDRLSLDAELETLATAVKNGAAIELGNIAPELQAIADDAAVMKRAQARASALLGSIPVASLQAPLAQAR